ncbi:TetR/AcrR family transcriptional regulator [Curtobacterium sp. ISL-83]|uniref:TetR/AcrR family transcriptional regulator n=1 Tax=Curtobacterium sp. ISL-83 TaxID=2819145 RepID=UPI001BE9AB64|nr:TetR/AcrR family transcriptional regulator [Curtobacterium sp. ISL-83]MBT2501719.1 TetR/AcrR family transcriptional regulator [Curtobacterium sp. ISL-83]
MAIVKHRGVGRPVAGGEDKRQRILSEASKVFAVDGYEAASLTTIAERSQISKAGLLHHFGSKSGLYTAVLERWEEENRAQWVPSDEPWDFIDSWVELAVRNQERAGTIALYTSLLPSVINPDHPARTWMHEHLDRSVALLVDGFDEGKRRGYIRADAPSVALARSLVALSDGIQVLWLSQLTAVQANPAEEQPRASGSPFQLAPQVQLFVDMIKESWSTTRP